MMLTDLADACRKSGLKVIEANGWRTRGHGQMAAVRTIVCHHTAGPSTGNMPSLNTIINGRPGLEGPLSQLGLARDGTVYVIADPDVPEGRKLDNVIGGMGTDIVDGRCSFLRPLSVTKAK